MGRDRLDFLYYGELAPDHTVRGLVEALIRRGFDPCPNQKEMYVGLP